VSILDIKNLNVSINTDEGLKSVLKDVSLLLQEGELHALVGESGCGKTLTAMSILNLLPKNAIVTSGEILYRGIDLTKLPKKEFEEIRGSKIALIPQDSLSSLNPLYTIGNQLLEVIKKHQHLEGEQAYKKAVEALELVQIPQAKTRLKGYPHEFSGGMRQRAIIAMALACNAKILIADEPTTALDVTIQAQIMDLLLEIKKEFKTSILLITHDLAVVEGYADNVSVMYSGRIVEQCSCKEFFSKPLHPYSRALLKSLPNPSKTKLEVIQGQPPSIYDNIIGCSFNPRCENKVSCCIKSIPNLKEVYPNHFAACHII
jgi:oligopeptide/dipeptide ABC transporter ATP-binding protein